MFRHDEYWGGNVPLIAVVDTANVVMLTHDAYSGGNVPLIAVVCT